ALQEAPAADVADQDDTLTVLFMCCHPALTPASAIALTLRAVGGLTTRQVANAFLVPEATMGQRISRAKARIKASGMPFRLPTADEQLARVRTVLRVLYLVFNEGYATSTGADFHRTKLSEEAIRLTRLAHRDLPDDPVVTLNRAVAAGMANGPAAGLALLDGVEQQLAGHYRLDVVRAHLLEMAGDAEAAIANYRRAAARTTSLPEQRYLTAQAAQLRAQ